MKFLSNLFGNKNQPSNNSSSNSVPPHMSGRHPDDIEQYQKRLRSIGSPQGQNLEAYAKRLICFELFQLTGQRMRADELDLNAKLVPEFGLDTLDLVELSMVFEEMYGEEITFPDWQPQELSHITSRDFIVALQRHFNR